ncbi:MAG: hypothetical protein ACRDYY_15145 [Acidimicrobiales bacterium]
MEFRRETMDVEFLDPRNGFEPASARVEVRWDPLTGQSSRLLPPAGMLHRSDFDLAALAEKTSPTCPFCAPRIEAAVPRYPAGLVPEGRIKVGEALLFPNLIPYSRHSPVSVYSPNRHFLPLSDMTAGLVADNLAVHVAFCRAVAEADPEAKWASINANHMLPSGSSIFHPHFQGGIHSSPTNMQRLLAEVPAERFEAYLRAETDAGERFIGEIGGTIWLAAFSPLGFADIRAFVPGTAAPHELSDAQVQDLGAGIAAALNLYADLGFESFNLAIYGAPAGTPGYPLNLRLLCRSNLEPLYRSDTMWMDKVHWEPVCDIWPEELAQQARSRFLG